jgi:hypothetical protein
MIFARTPRISNLHNPSFHLFDACYAVFLAFMLLIVASTAWRLVLVLIFIPMGTFLLSIFKLLGVAALLAAFTLHLGTLKEHGSG